MEMRRKFLAKAFVFLIGFAAHGVIVLMMNKQELALICGNQNCDSGETCLNCPEDCGSCPTGKPIYILWLNHFKEHVNVEDDAKILNDLMDLFDENDMPVEWTTNGVLLQAFKDGVKWSPGHGHSTDEWLFKPNPEIIQKLQNARNHGDVFSSFSDTFMPYWGIGKIQSGKLTSFDDALALELERNTYYHDPVSGEIDTSRTGGQFKIYEEIFGEGNAYVFHPYPEPQYEYAKRIMDGQNFGADYYLWSELSSQYEGPWFWYMGDMHYSFYAPNLLDGVTHWQPTSGTKHIDEDINAMKNYVGNSNTKYGAMYAGVHTFGLYSGGCMNAGEYDYDNPPSEKCIESPYSPNNCHLVSYSIGSFADITDPQYDTSCYQYLNSENSVPTDWYEMMHNPDTYPSPAVVQQGRKEEIYQRNLDYLTGFVEKLKQRADSDSQIVIVTRETAEDLVQQEEGRQINKDTIYDIAVFLINNWKNERPPDFVYFTQSSSAVDGGSDYFTIAESYRLLHKSLTSYHSNGVLLSEENKFVLAPTGLGKGDDIETSTNRKFSINDIMQTAISISPINQYGDYQIDDNVVVDGNEINPAEFLLLMAKVTLLEAKSLPILVIRKELVVIQAGVLIKAGHSNLRSLLGSNILL